MGVDVRQISGSPARKKGLGADRGQSLPNTSTHVSTGAAPVRRRRYAVTCLAVGRQHRLLFASMHRLPWARQRESGPDAAEVDVVRQRWRPS